MRSAHRRKAEKPFLNVTQFLARSARFRRIFSYLIATKPAGLESLLDVCIFFNFFIIKNFFLCFCYYTTKFPISLSSTHVMSFEAN